MIVIRSYISCAATDVASIGNRLRQAAGQEWRGKEGREAILEAERHVSNATEELRRAERVLAVAVSHG